MDTWVDVFAPTNPIYIAFLKESLGRDALGWFLPKSSGDTIHGGMLLQR